MAAVAGHTLVTETLQFIGSSLMRMQDDKIKTPEHIRLLQQFAFSKNLSWKKLSNFICAHWDMKTLSIWIYLVYSILVKTNVTTVGSLIS